MTMSIDYADLVPGDGWFPLDVLPTEDGRRGRQDWVALFVDVPPDELRHCVCKVAWLYVHPDEYRPDKSRVAREVLVRIPGRHRSANAARDALDAMLSTLH
jgi:hypothetical protein